MYYLVYGLMYAMSLLPMWLLYGFSDGVALFLYAVIRYRRSVVLSNLRIVFPEKTEVERLRIARKFYRNFTDNFMETIKLLSASPVYLQKHFVIDNPEVMEDFHDRGPKDPAVSGAFVRLGSGQCRHAPAYPLHLHGVLYAR